MRLPLRMLAPALLLGSMPGAAVAQAQIAVIDFQTALLNTADMKKESAALEAKYRDRQEEIQRLSTELEGDPGQAPDRDPGTRPTRCRTKVSGKQRTAQRLSEDLQSDVEFDRQNILGLRQRADAGGHS